MITMDITTHLILAEHATGQLAQAAGAVNGDAATILRTVSGIIGYHADRITQIIDYGPEGVELPRYSVPRPEGTSADVAEVDGDQLAGNLVPRILAIAKGRPMLRDALRIPGRQPGDWGEWCDLLAVMDSAWAWTIPDLLTSAANRITARAYAAAGQPAPRPRAMMPSPDGSRAAWYCPICGHALDAAMDRCLCGAPGSALAFYPSW